MHFMMDSLIRAPVEEISRVLHLPVTVDRNATDRYISFPHFSMILLDNFTQFI